MQSFDLGKALANLGRIIHAKYSEDLEPLGLGSGQMRVLLLVMDAPGIGQTAICENLKINKSVTSRSLKTLVMAGFLRKNRSFGRLKYFPSKLALALEKQIRSTSEQLATQLSNGFSDEELDSFKVYIQRAKANLERPPAETIRPEFLPVDF